MFKRLEDAKRTAGDILPHSLSTETALEYEKRALAALSDYLATPSNEALLREARAKLCDLTSHYDQIGKASEIIAKIDAALNPPGVE